MKYNLKNQKAITKKRRILHGAIKCGAYAGISLNSPIDDVRRKYGSDCSGTEFALR